MKSEALEWAIQNQPDLYNVLGPTNMFAINHEMFTHVWVTRPFSEWLDKFSRYYRFFLVGNPPPKKNTEKTVSPKQKSNQKFQQNPQKNPTTPISIYLKPISLPTPR